MPVLLISVDNSEANILTEFGGTTHPQTDPLKINFFNGFCYSCSFYLIFWNTEKTNSWTRASERGGPGGQWPRGPWILGGSWAREGAHPNDIEKWKAHQSRMRTAWFWPEKPLKFPIRPFCFLDHIIFLTNQQHFLRLFWTLQNHNCVTFELAPGPRSALGAPDLDILWKCHPPKIPKWTSQKSIFGQFDLRLRCFWY